MSDCPPGCRVNFNIVYSLQKNPFISAHPQIIRFGASLAVHLILIIMSTRWCCSLRYPLVTDRPLCFLSGTHAWLEWRLISRCWMVYPAQQVHQRIMINEISYESQENVYCFVSVFKDCCVLNNINTTIEIHQRRRARWGLVVIYPHHLTKLSSIPSKLSYVQVILTIHLGKPSLTNY